MDTSIDEIYNDIKKSMKQIIEETNTILKHSHSAFKKTKDKMIDLEKLQLNPNENLKIWFEKRNKNFTIPDLFEILFKEASEQNRLFHVRKTNILNNEDAELFGFKPNIEISIYDLFEKIPNYFQ